MAKPFVWFGPETVAELWSQLNVAGLCRLEIHEDEARNVTLVLVPIDDAGAKGKPLQPLNESHWCPPDC